MEKKNIQCIYLWILIKIAASKEKIKPIFIRDSANIRVCHFEYLVCARMKCFPVLSACQKNK